MQVKEQRERDYVERAKAKPTGDKVIISFTFNIWTDTLSGKGSEQGRRSRRSARRFHDVGGDCESDFEVRGSDEAPSRKLLYWERQPPQRLQRHPPRKPLGVSDEPPPVYGLLS